MCWHTWANGGVEPRAVSGRGRVAAFTINLKQWAPRMEVPFVYAAVELEEQAELYVMTNITGCAVDDVYARMPVTVRFEAHEDVWLPMFEPTGDGDGR